jgi:plastocyanin
MAKIVLLAAALAAASGSAFAGEAPTAAPAVVEIRNMKFIPATLTIRPGTEVIWVNEDAQPHTVSDRAGAFRSAALDTKEKFSHLFAAPGEFNYFCTIHPMMVGRIVVK